MADMPKRSRRASRATALFAYVGAFTTPERKGHGGGINVYRVDPASGAWTHEQLLEIVNPSFLTLDRAQRFLYSVHADLDEVSAYAIDKQNGHITALNRQSCGGKNPVHLSIDPTGRWIITANYSAGSVGVVPIEKDGTLGPRADLVTLPGEPGPDRIDRPARIRTTPSSIRAADSSPCPTGARSDLRVSPRRRKTGKLAPNDPPFVATRVRDGPRHIAFHRKMPLAYVINELDSSVVTYRFDRSAAACIRSRSCRPRLRATLASITGAEIAVAPWSRRLRVEPVPQQHRHLSPSIEHRNPDADRLGSDPRKVAALFWPRPCRQISLRSQR